MLQFKLQIALTVSLQTNAIELATDWITIFVICRTLTCLSDSQYVRWLLSCAFHVHARTYWFCRISMLGAHLQAKAVMWKSIVLYNSTNFLCFMNWNFWFVFCIYRKWNCCLGMFCVYTIFTIIYLFKKTKCQAYHAILIAAKNIHVIEMLFICRLRELSLSKLLRNL